MVVTLKQLSEDEKIRMQCEAREDYERRILTARHAGEEKGRALERVNTERERERADAAEKELAELKKLLAMQKN